MKDYCGYVNVFQGCDEIDLPRPEGVAAAWRFIKGLCGNNTPAAALPFGRITAGCYSGGYSSGYGRLKANTHGEIEKLWPRNMFRGMSHIQNDGTGYIDTFYNYAVLSPFRGDLRRASDPRPFSDEAGKPGYYACRDSLTGALCEVTVTKRAALHRLTFPAGSGRVSIDFSNDGLYDGGGKLRAPAGEARLALLGGDAAEISARLQNLTIYFCVRVEGAPSGLRLWADGEVLSAREVCLDAGRSFGVVFDTEARAEVTLGLSPRGAEIARRDALENPLTFDEAVSRAADAWNDALSRIDARFDDRRDYEIFYSNMYHSLIKPCDFSGESFLYDQEEFTSEFATIWDQYKTQLPLIYALYPDMGRRIVATMLNVARATKKMPHTLMLCRDYEGVAPTQARMLAEYSIVDAFWRGVDFDRREAMRLMLEDTFDSGRFDQYAENWRQAQHKAFLIDITDACAACADVARAIGEGGAAERFEAVARQWVNAYDPDTGLLKDGERFYEGTRWNYSFRLVHDMDRRMALSGGPEGFARLADRFFGFAGADAEGCCFEGFNNETDMEAPYVYHFAGRHDRLSEVIDGALRYMFTTGRGGVPGNNDSGGLSSCYLWNALGVFPVSGQNLMIVGSPRVRRARMALANGREFAIRREGDGIYVKEAYFNGERLGRLSFAADDMMLGGDLRLVMTGDAAQAQMK